MQKFYMGGDREEPVKIFEIDTSVYDGLDIDRDHRSLIDGYISNLGPKKDDWIVGIRYSKYDKKRFSYEEQNSDGITRTFYLEDDVHYLTIITPQKLITYSDRDVTGIGNLNSPLAGKTN